jgi:hypothetical protein
MDVDAKMTNCILWDNEAVNGHEIHLKGLSAPFSALTIRYSDVQGGVSEAYVGSGCTLDLDATNIDADPLFVRGPLGRYYLSQIAAGQAADSPCVDAGSDTAANLGLDGLSTRTDGIGDEGVVDMGYHAPYALWIDKIEMNGDDITIYWNALPGVSYIVQWSTEMDFATYAEVPVGATNTWTDVGGALEARKYYRVREE